MVDIKTQVVEQRDETILNFEFRKAIAWGWSILGIFSIISALTSQSTIESWQIYYSAAVFASMLLSYLLDFKYQSAIVYAPIPLVQLFAPFFLTDESQIPWISIGLIVVATIISISNISDPRISISLSIFAILLQQIIAWQDLPSITDTNDLLLLNGYFGISWCLLITFGLFFIRRGYIRYHENIEEQLNIVYENQLVNSKNALAINTLDYRNLQLHGTVLNTLIFARDNLNFSITKNRLELSKILKKDLATLANDSTVDGTLESRIRALANQIEIRELNIWLEPIKDFQIEENIKLHILEILREKIINLKKHTSALNCDISIEIKAAQISGFAFVRPIQYYLVIEVVDDALRVEKFNTGDHRKGVLASKSLNRILEPLLAKQKVAIEAEKTKHTIEIPLINFKANAAQELYRLRNKSQEFIAKSCVLISMIYGAICLPALLRVNIPIEVFLLSAVIVVLSFISVFTPKFNISITTANAAIAMLPILIGINQSDLCKDLDYLPWIFNGIIGPIFFAVLTIPNRFVRWVPAILFLMESIIATNLLPVGCKTLLSGSTPGIIILTVLAILVVRIRKQSYQNDLGVIRKFQVDAYTHAETRLRLDLERSEIINRLSKFARTVEAK